MVLAAKGSHKTLTYRGPLNNTLAYNALHSSVNDIIDVSDLRLSFDVIPKELGQNSELTAVLGKRDRYFRLRLDLSEPNSPRVELQSGYAPQEGQTSVR